MSLVDWSVRMLAIAATVGLLALAIAVAVAALQPEKPEQPAAVAPQEPVAAVDPGALTGLPRLPDRLPAVPVLTYHHLAADGGRYTVRPGDFAEQMAALDRAGFETITEAKLVRFLDGSRVELPARPLVITFDDGTKATWTVADPALERYGFRAITYPVTSLVGSGSPYYLTWEEAQKMGESGRWTFGSHTDDGHHMIPTDADESTGAFLTNRRWRTAAGRAESVAEWRSRVTRDLRRSRAELASHGLPGAGTFADPFSSANSAAVDPELLPRLDLILERLFAAHFNNQDPPGLAQPGDGRDFVRRIEVFRNTSGRGLIKEIRGAVDRARNPTE